MAKKLMKGSEAIAEAAVRAGCKLFFGYPITPQNEIPEYLARRLPEIGGRFVQAESEVAASNMVYGAAGTGERVFTSSSSPGVSLMPAAISDIAGDELPCLIINIMRSGPGLGGILASQADYFQTTKGGGHGDYKCLTLAPWSVQEAVDLVQDGFDLADYYRNPVFLLGDALIGQMMEPCEFHDDRKPCKELPPKDWATTGERPGKPRGVVNSLYLDPEELERHNQRLTAKYERMKQEVRVATYGADGPCDIAIVAYGTVARVCSSALEALAKDGIQATLVRPITLVPYPYEAVRAAAERAKVVLTVELSTGQMLEDVKLAVAESRPVHFLGRQGGILVSTEEVVGKAKELVAASGATAAKGRRTRKEVQHAG